MSVSFFATNMILKDDTSLERAYLKDLISYEQDNSCERIHNELLGFNLDLPISIIKDTINQIINDSFKDKYEI